MAQWWLSSVQSAIGAGAGVVVVVVAAMLMYNQ
jgi:hypothetical protein